MNIIPDITTKRLAIKLSPAAEKMVKKGHPWVFEKGIKKISGSGKAGDLAIIYDTKKNTFLACGLYDPDSPIRIKVLQFGTPAQITSDWFLDKIKSAYQLRSSLLATDTNSYRLVFGENDGFPGLIIDVYDSVLVVKVYSSIWFPYFNTIIAHAISVTSCVTVVLRLSRLLQAKAKTFGVHDGQVLYGVLADDVVVFKEHGIRFSANVIHGHKTGYFLDHRHNRKRVGELAKGKTVLDVFSYAGGFSVHALAGGASAVTSLDISAQALDMAKQNVSLNPHDGEHQCIVGDAFEKLQALIHKGVQYDIVVIDPPSFAKSEHEIDRAKHSYERLAKIGGQLVATGGILILASCSSRVIATDFFEISERTLFRCNGTIKILDRTYHDIDHPITFPEGAYLKCGYYQF